MVQGPILNLVILLGLGIEYITKRFLYAIFFVSGLCMLMGFMFKNGYLLTVFPFRHAHYF